MSTVSQTKKINTVRTPGIRNSTLFIVAALALAVIVVYANAVASRALMKPVDNSAYMLYRQGEWLSVPIPVSNLEAYQIFRQGEVTSPVTNAQAYQIFRAGETASSPVVTDAEAYHLFRLGEWASPNIPVGATLDLAAYRLSERTLVVPLTGMEIYLASERTSVPSLFNPYQRSEWFGQ